MITAPARGKDATTSDADELVRTLVLDHVPFAGLEVRGNKDVDWCSHSLHCRAFIFISGMWVSRRASSRFA